MAPLVAIPATALQRVGKLEITGQINLLLGFPNPTRNYLYGFVNTHML